MGNQSRRFGRLLPVLNARASPSNAPQFDELLRRVGRGDEAAFAALYDAVCARVYGLALRIVRDPGMAEDVAQEALIQVWRTAARFDPTKGTGLSWVLTIVHQRAVDRIRTETAHAARTRRAATAEVPFDEVTEAVTASVEAQAVRRCLAGLTDLQREAITLAYYGGHTYPQVAQLLDVPLPTVKTRLRDGLIRLRDCLGVSLG